MTVGRHLGNVAGVLQGLIEIDAGMTMTGGGAAACLTGVGCTVGAPVAGAGLAVAGHGALVAGSALAAEGALILHAVMGSGSEDGDLADLARWNDDGGRILQERDDVSWQLPKRIEISKSQYPEAARHIEKAQAKGRDKILTIDRAGAQIRRRQSMKGHPARSGFDRDDTTFG